MPNSKIKKVRNIKRHFRHRDPALASVLAMMELEPLQRERNAKQYFSRLCREIIGQQLAGKAAYAIHQRFLKLFPKQRITPERVLACPEKKLRSVGMSWAKARSVRDLAQKTYNQAIRWSELHALDNEAVITELTKIKGIGRWTAEMFLIFTLGREDVFSYGDLGLRKGLERIYGKRRIQTQENIEAITNKWSPYRSYGSLVLWHSVDPPKNRKTKFAIW